MTPKKLFNLLAKFEAVTWSILLTALILRSFQINPLVVTIAGGIHGAIFLGYSVIALLVGINQRWKVRLTLLALVLAIVPFATIPLELKLNRGNQLVGDWRRQESQNPADKSWIDLLFRWFINRPVTLVLFIVISLSAIFSFLLFLGPPDQWFKNN